MNNLDHPEFDEVIEKNQNSIYRICEIYSSSPIEPEDLFQEVVLHIWKAFPSFEQKSNINTWIYRIALNVCMRYKSKLEKSNHSRFDSIQYQIPATSPDQALQEKYNALQSCIRSLNKIDKSLVILILEEFKYKEIAQITGLSENHIAVKVKRLKKNLLICINQKLG